MFLSCSTTVKEEKEEKEEKEKEEKEEKEDPTLGIAIRLGPVISPVSSPRNQARLRL